MDIKPFLQFIQETSIKELRGIPEVQDAIKDIDDDRIYGIQISDDDIQFEVTDITPEEEERLEATGLFDFAEEEELDEARFRLVNRVRGKKIQRRKKVANKPGYTIRNGKVLRLKAKERRNRRLSQRKAAKKRKAKISRANRNRKISLRKRKRLGGNRR